MLNLNEFSIENLKRFQKALRIILDELELQGINRLAGNKISLKRFEKEGFDYEKIKSILNKIGKEENDVIRVINEIVKESLKTNFLILENPFVKEIFLKEHGFSLDDLYENKILLLQIKNLNELKEIKEGVDKKLKKEDYIRRPVEIFTNEVVPDRTAEIEKQMQEGQIRQSERIEREKLHREQMKQDRILRTPVDKYTHALDLIIERAEYAEDGNSFSIEFYDFNFEKMIGSRMLEKFLTEMQKDGCFEKYERTNYAGGTRFSFIKVNIKNLKKLKTTRENQIIPLYQETPIQGKSAILEALKERVEKANEKRILKQEIIEELKSKKETQDNKKPFCMVENNWSYLKFDKYGEKIKIGTPKSRHFRLLECLLEPFGKAKTIETVYEWIKLPKDKKDSDLSGWDNYKKKSRQIIIIQNAIKELQKGNKLRGKLAFEFDDTKSKIWIEYLE